jgi:membrane protease YdiL (CAAX protease family)
MDARFSTSSVLFRACCVAIGVAGFAILASYTVNEIFSRLTGTSNRELEALVFQSLQIGLSLFVVWPLISPLRFPKLRLGIVLASIMFGAGLAVWSSTDLQHLLGLNSAPPRTEPLQPADLLFASGLAHAAFWLLHTGLLVPVAENTIYRQLLFKFAEPAPVYAVAVVSVATYALAYGFNSGIEGLLFALQLGIVFAALRAYTKSVIYPIISHITYGVLIEGTALFLVLP